MADHEDELAASQTEGYKKPKEATLEDMKNLDKDDEALNKWKESLLKGVSDGSLFFLFIPFHLFSLFTFFGKKNFFFFDFLLNFLFIYLFI